MFEGVKGFSTVPTVEESDVGFVEPKKENERVSQFDVVSIIICVIMAFFALMTIIATFLMWTKERDALQLQRNRSDSSPSDGRRPNSGSFSGRADANGPVQEESGCVKFLRSFSALQNMRTLSKPRAKMGDQELEVMNGLRVICCCLIILGNSYFYTLRSPIQNIEVI